MALQIWVVATVHDALLPFDSAQGDGHGERSRTMLAASFRR